MEGKAPCTLTVIPVQSLSKLVLGDLVKMCESNGMEITSAASELKPWWAGRSKEAVKHLVNLRLSPREEEN